MTNRTVTCRGCKKLYDVPDMAAKFETWICVLCRTLNVWR